MMDRICIRYCKGPMWNQCSSDSLVTRPPCLDSGYCRKALRALSSTGTSALRYAVLESLRGFYQYLRGVMIIINSLSCVKLLIFHYPSFACAIYRVLFKRFIICFYQFISYYPFISLRYTGDNKATLLSGSWGWRLPTLGSIPSRARELSGVDHGILSFFGVWTGKQTKHW